MRPYEKLKTIYEIASRMIVRGEGAWKDYLSFAARFHKYSFDNALLVYAQNPDVTTLASIPQWNKVGRNVNRGSKGIAVCEYENAKLTLSYLFDISQTNGREIRFLDWQLDDDMKSEIATRLIRADELSATDFAETVKALASKRVNENYENCLRSIMANSQNHIFSELPQGGLEEQLISLLTDSTAYFIGKRCGLDDNEIMLEGGMSTISDFNRIPLIATLGNTVTNCAKEILIEMELTIKTINAERTANNERKQSEYQLHREERNIVPESASIQRADSRSAVGQIRQNGDGVSERKPPQSLYSFENGWQSDDNNALGTADSHRKNRGTDTGDAVERANARHRGHDGTDTALEQPETVSRGNRNKGNRADTEIKTENVVVAEPPKDGSVVVSEDNPKAKMSDDEIVKHYETILMSTDIYPIEMHRRLYLILKDEPDNSDWQSVSNEVYSIFAEYGNREYQGEVLYRTELVNKDGISMFFGDGSTYLPWIFVANIINAMIVDGDYPGVFTQLFEEARKILEKAEYVVSDEYLMAAVLELQKEKIYNPTALQIAEQTEAVIIRDAEDIEEEDFSAVVTAVEHSDDTEDLFSEPVEAQQKAVRKPRAKQDLPSRNYRAFAKLFPDIVSGKYSALMLSAGESFDPLEICHKGGNRYSMEHYWMNNDDKMYDPYMEFIIDRENQTIQAASYENSNVGLTQQVFTDEGYYPQLQKELNSFLSNWLKNISFQDYEPVRAIQIVNNEEKTVTFPIVPETPQLNLFTDLSSGEQMTMTDISSDEKKETVIEPEIDENAEFKILEECTGSHHGQIDMLMTAYKGEIPVGYMQYSIFEDTPHINYIEVMPSQRRRGIATRLLQNLQGQYPASEIVWGMLTDDGKALHDAITYSFDSEDYESVKRGLDEVNKGLAEFHQRIDEGESLNDDETAFMNDLSDIQYKLEKQLEDLSPKHTFVRLPKAETAAEPIAEKPTQKPQNFRYSEGMELYPTGLKSKYKANIEAIKLLKSIEEERRQATPDEQIILARYVGWGGLANAFNPKAKDWEKEYQELKLLLTEAEYKAAMDSTITAYYTEPELIKSIYTALDNFGFEGGKNRKLLDPAMGTGNFFSVLPEHLSDTKLYGVEIDSITGRIAKLLYPNVSIENTGYETTKYEDNFFDVIIGNIPFNSIHIYDPRYKDNDFYIHDYFFAKSLDLAKPGGIIAFITSKGTMDKYDDSVRKYIASRAEFIGAIRLPNTAFKAVAGTEVTADIVFLKKREEPIEEWNLEDELWFDVSASMQTNWVRYNNYFIQHPEMVLGEMQHSKKMYGREDGTACVAPDDYNFNLNEKLRVAVGNLSAQFTAQPDKERKPIHTVAIDETPEYENAPPGTKNFTFVVKDDNIYYCEKDKLIPQPHTGKKAERIKGLCGIRTALLDVINLQSGQYDESELKEKQKVLNDVYDAFVKKYGAIGSNANILVFSDDDQFPLLRSIENEIKNPDGTKSFEKAQIFYKATIHPRTIPTSADTAVEALYISLNTRLKVDLRYMSQLTGKQPIDVINELGDRIFLNPQRYSGNILDGWETAEEYLSGHVQDKLVYAEYYAEKEPDLFSRNVRALEEAQPVPLGPSDINAPVGAPWIPIEYYRQFMYETFDTPSEYRYESENDSEKECITLNYMEYTTVWRVLNKFYDRDSVKVYQTFGTNRKNAYEIFEDSLNQQITTVKDRVEYVLISGHESYTIEEVDTAERYIVPESQRTAIEWNKVTEKSFYNELKRGNLTVKKSSEDGFVKGMRFHLYGTSFSGIKVDEYATTNADGIAYFNDILIGTGFTIEEVNTPVRYVIPDRQTADIAWDELTETEFTNTLKKWRADVFKLDAELAGESDIGGGEMPENLLPMALSLTSDETVNELGSPYGDSQGDATLAGAVYGVYKGSELIDTYKTDENGYFLTKYYPCGDDWTIREITPSNGYLLDPTVYYMDASAEFYSIELNTIYPDVYEEIIKAKIAIIKHTDDGSTQIETPEVGAEFEIYLKSAGSYENAKPTERDILVCDEDGFAESIDLPYGTYIVHQTKGWDGREFMPDFEVKITENGKCYKYLINNANFAAYLKIVKVDSETGKTIPYAGATFEIYDPDGKLVEMTTTYPEVVKHTQFKTNAEGYLITPEVLEYGLQYSVVELVAPYGYVLDSTPVYFDVSADNSEIAEGITIVKTEKKNAPQKGVINIYKSGEIFSSVIVKDDKYTPVYAEAGLDGTEFDIIADEDIITPDGTLRYSKDEIVDHIVTTGGNATSKALYLGKYRIVETKSSYGMVLNKEVLYAELTYAGQEIELTSTSVAMYNERQKASITLSKIMEQNDIFGIGNNGEIKSVSFGLYAAEKLTAADGSFIPADGLLEVVYCDENGKITFNSDIPVGAKLYVQEMTTDKHYIVSPDKHLIQFDYAEQTVTLVEIKVNNDTAIDNKLIYGSVKGLKLDEDGNAIVGAVFGLFVKDETEFTEEKALMTAVSGEDGVFTFEKVAYGSWVVREIKTASEKYVLNDTVYLVEVTEDGAVIEYELENRYVRGSVQVTKVDADYPDTKLTGAVFEIYLDVDGNKEYNADIDTLVGEMSETELGVYRMDELKYGGYFLYEKISPDMFVKIDDYFYFEIKIDGEVVKVENLEGVGFANKPVVGSLKIVKTSSDGKIEGFSFRVTGENGYDQIFKTNANGEIIIEGLRLGKYTVSEVSDDISAGYILAEDVTVTVEADKEVIAEMHNEKKPVPDYPDSPQTGDNSNIGLWIFLMLASATALVVLLFVSKRKEVQ